MKEKKDLKKGKLPPEMLIRIFSVKNLMAVDLLRISIVCKKWSVESLDNKIWKPLFIKRFSYLPQIDKPNNRYKQSYKRQLQLIEKYKHHLEKYSDNQPSLLQKSIETEDLSLTEALLETDHKIVVNNFALNANTESFINNLFAFIAKCTDLPSDIFSKLICGFIEIKQDDHNNKKINSIPSGNLICLINLLGDETLLRKVICKLGNNIASHLYDMEDAFDEEYGLADNFIIPVIEYGTIAQLKILLDSLGQDASYLLTHQRNLIDIKLPYTNKNIQLNLFSTPSAIYYAALTNKGPQLELILKYLKPCDYKVFMSPSDENLNTPFFEIAASNNLVILNKIVNDIWGVKQTKTNLLYSNKLGMSVLQFCFNTSPLPKESINFILNIMGVEECRNFFIYRGPEILSSLMDYGTTLEKLQDVVSIFTAQNCMDVVKNFLKISPVGSKAWIHENRFEYLLNLMGDNESRKFLIFRLKEIIENAINSNLRLHVLPRITSILETYNCLNFVKNYFFSEGYNRYLKINDHFKFFFNIMNKIERQEFLKKRGLLILSHVVRFKKETELSTLLDIFTENESINIAKEYFNDEQFTVDSRYLSERRLYLISELQVDYGIRPGLSCTIL